jgi:uncharacterized protein involved in outer membrane biogenesis
MKDTVRRPSKLKWAAFILLGVVLAAGIFVSLFNWNALRPALARRITAATGRPTTIDGDLKVHLWSWSPSAEVDQLSLENPPWADRHLMFGAKRIVVSVSLLHLLRGQVVVPLLELDQPVINLERDARGRASWELGSRAGTPNGNTKPAQLPALQRVVIEQGELHVVDKLRKLTFSGSLVAAEQAGRDDPSAFKIRCQGTLNAKPFRLEANGGPLLAVTPNEPYTFQVNVTASDIDLKTHITVRKPFDLSAIDVQFALSGNDLADAFYLTGLALPNTPPYRLEATVHREGTTLRIDGLKGHLGGSDLSGHGLIDTGGARPKLVAKLASAQFNMVDLEPTVGQPATRPKSLAANNATNGNAPAPRSPPTAAGADAKAGASADSETNQPVAHPGNRLLPDADLQVNRVRGMDADVTFQAGAVNMPKVPMRELNFHLFLDNGLLTLDPLSFVLDAGKFSGKVAIDARHDVPVSSIDMRIDAVDLGEFKSATAKQAPLEGSMLGRFQFRGAGSSIHKFAAASTGNLSVVIPHGQASDALAELTGINVLRGLGLLLAKGQSDTEIRCGIVDFKDQNGMLDTTTVYVDTSNVLITGRGHIDLGSEDLDLALQGDPKKLRLLRLRSPITLRGTLLHPTIGVNAGKLAEQVGVAAALGTLLTPAAAALAFIDPGLAKNKDCSTVFDQANAGVAQADAGVASRASPPSGPDSANNYSPP